MALTGSGFGRMHFGCVHILPANTCNYTILRPETQSKLSNITPRIDCSQLTVMLLLRLKKALWKHVKNIATTKSSKQNAAFWETRPSQSRNKSLKKNGYSAIQGKTAKKQTYH